MPLPSRRLSLWGRVDLHDAEQLVVKSWRSRVMFSLYVLQNRFAGVREYHSKQALREISELLTSGDRVTELTGAIRYRETSGRDRSYWILYTSSESFFVKTGLDLRHETLSAEYVSRLEGAGFRPILPASTMTEAGECVLWYEHLPGPRFTSARFSPALASRFVEQLNPSGSTDFVRLNEYLADRSSILYTNFSRQEVAVILDALPSMQIQVGRVHGDLLNPNILFCNRNKTFAILDWETYATRAPLLLDLLGSTRDWSNLQHVCGLFVARKSNLSSEKSELLAFLLLAVSHGYGPATRWLQREMRSIQRTAGRFLRCPC